MKSPYIVESETIYYITQIEKDEDGNKKYDTKYYFYLCLDGMTVKETLERGEWRGGWTTDKSKAIKFKKEDIDLLLPLL